MTFAIDRLVVRGNCSRKCSDCLSAGSATNASNRFAAGRESLRNRDFDEGLSVLKEGLALDSG